MGLASIAFALFWPQWFHILSSSSNWKTRTRCTWFLWLSSLNTLTNSCLSSLLHLLLPLLSSRQETKYLNQLKALFNLIIQISVRNNVLRKDFAIQSLLLCYRNNFHTGFHVNKMKSENYRSVGFFNFLYHQLYHFVIKKNKNLHFVRTHYIYVSFSEKQIVPVLSTRNTYRF